YTDVQQGAALGNGAGDVAIIDGFARLLNPNAAVNQHQSDVIQNSLPLVSKWLNLAPQQVFQGGQLTPEARQQIMNAANNIHGSIEANMARVIHGYTVTNPQARSLPPGTLEQA